MRTDKEIEAEIKKLQDLEKLPDWLACPNCDHTNTLSIIGDEMAWYQVACECGVMGPKGVNPQNAIVFWNTGFRNVTRGDSRAFPITIKTGTSFYPANKLSTIEMDREHEDEQRLANRFADEIAESLAINRRVQINEISRIGIRTHLLAFLAAVKATSMRGKDPKGNLTPKRRASLCTRCDAPMIRDTKQQLVCPNCDHDES